MYRKSLLKTKRWYIFGMLLLISGAAIPIANGNEGANNEAIALLERGVQLYRHRRHKDAKDAFERATASDPENAEAWYLLGRTLMFSGRWEEAVQAFERSLDLNPEKAKAEKRKNASLRVIEWKEKRQEWREKGGEWKEKWQTEFEKLEGVGQEWRERHLSRREVYEEGARLFEEERYEEAVDAFRQVIEDMPQYFRAWKDKGKALWELDRLEEAIAAYQKALEIKPGHPVVQLSKESVQAQHQRRVEEEAKPVIELTKYEEDMMISMPPHWGHLETALPAILHARLTELPQRFEEYEIAADKLFDERLDADVAEAALILSQAPHNEILQHLNIPDNREEFWLQEGFHLIYTNKAYRHYVILLSINEYVGTSRTFISRHTGHRIRFPETAKLPVPQWAEGEARAYDNLSLKRYSLFQGLTP